MRIDAVPIGKNPPEDINVIIEVSVGGEPIKYEMDKDAGAMYVDRFLYTPMRYPGNYGFVPHTLVRRRRPDRRCRGQPAPGGAGCDHELPSDWRSPDGRRIRPGRERSSQFPSAQADQAL